MYSLYLFNSSSQNNAFSEKELYQFLQAIEFIAPKGHQFLPSDSFMELITFMGCSPNLGDELKTVVSCYLYPHLQAVGGDSINKIICPNCKSLIKNPSALISNFKTNPIWQSPCCDEEIDLKTINWRKSAGFSHTFIEMSHIFPKEAIPTDNLLHKLSDFSQSRWHYFYSKST